jgi:hypothetical protein
MTDPSTSSFSSPVVIDHILPDASTRREKLSQALGEHSALLYFCS